MLIFVSYSPGELRVGAFESPSFRHFKLEGVQADGTFASPAVREDGQPKTRRLHCVAPRRKPRSVSQYDGKQVDAHQREVAKDLQGRHGGVWYPRVHLLGQLWQPSPAGGALGQASDGTRAPGPKR